MWGRKSIKAIIFDIGGVLLHADLDGFIHIAGLAFGCIPEKLAPIAAPLIADLERGEIDSYSMWDDLGQQLEASGLGVAQAPEKMEWVWQTMLQDSVRVDEGMMELCSRLCDMMPVAALSNTIEEHAKHFEELGMYRMFNPCVLSFEVGKRKPEPDIYLQVSRLLNIPPQNCLFIDDREDNIAGAKAVKMQTHLFVDQEKLEADLVKRKILKTLHS